MYVYFKTTFLISPFWKTNKFKCKEIWFLILFKTNLLSLFNCCNMQIMQCFLGWLNNAINANEIISIFLAAYADDYYPNAVTFECCVCWCRFKALYMYGLYSTQSTKISHLGIRVLNSPCLSYKANKFRRPRVTTSVAAR